MLPEFEREGQRSTVKVTGDKKQQSAALFSGAVLGGTSRPVGKSAHAV